MGFSDVFGGTAIYPSNATYIKLVLTADVSLNWPIEQQIGGDLIVADIIDLSTNTPGLSVILPDARVATQGFTTLFNNVGAQNVTIKNALGGTLATVVPGSAWQIYLTDNSTQSGTWQSFQYGASISVANAAALVGNGLINIGTALSLNLAVTAVSTTPFVLDANSRARIFEWTSGVGAFSVPDASTLGNGWFAILRNRGSGNVTITPTAGTIDGAANVVMAPGGSVIVVSDGTNYITLFSGTGGSGGGSFNLLSIDVSGAGDYVLSGPQLGQVGYKLTGVLSGTRNLVVPGTVAQYWVDNETTGAFNLFVKTNPQTPGVQVLPTTRNILYCDGTNVLSAESASVSFPIAVAQGGTGAITAAAARTNLGVPPSTRLVATGTGLSGGGDLSADRTLILANTAVAPGSYTGADITVDAQGRLTAAANGVITAYKSANTVRSSTTTPTNDPDLVFTALPTGTYEFEGLLTYACAGGGAGLRWNFLPSGTIVSYADLALATQNGAAPVAAFQTANARSDSNFVNVFDHNPNTSGFDVSILIKGVFQVTVSGDLHFQWSQSVSSATATTLKLGSYIKARRMGP